MIEKIMGAGNGVHLHHLILEIFVQNIKGQKTDFTDTNSHNLSLVRSPMTAPQSSTVPAQE